MAALTLGREVQVRARIKSMWVPNLTVSAIPRPPLATPVTPD